MKKLFALICLFVSLVFSCGTIKEMVFNESVPITESSWISPEMLEQLLRLMESR